jgi:negative regulator of sigma E activity
MKCDIVHTILVFAVGVCVMLDVIFTVRAVNGQREMRQLQIQATMAQAALMRVQQFEGLVNDTRAYNQLHPSPDLARILGPLQPRPATH